MSALDLAALSAGSREAFAAALGGVFEHSPWIAGRAYDARPFADVDALHAAMVAALANATPEAQLALIRAHPELAGKEAASGTLTAESTGEQASAGLDRCTPQELERLREGNRAYVERFGFPFVMAVKGRSRHEILAALASRLEHSRGEEFARALAEIAKIARLRLAALFGDDSGAREAVSREGFFPVRSAELSYREIGEGRPIIVIHGGPDFDSTYLLPDMDRLSDSYRLIYYDQRGRGKSRGDLRLEEIGIETYVEDLDRLRLHLRLDEVAILGHSWGAHVAMQYAIRHPHGVSHMILMNTAPASHEHYVLMCRERVRRRAPRQGELNALLSSSRYREGDPDAVAEYYRVDFGAAFKRPQLIAMLDLGSTREDVLRGRAIEERLMNGLYWSEGFTLIPELEQLPTPTLVIHGDYDFVPVECAAQIAQAIPGARLVVIGECGHFAYIEAPEQVHRAIDEFFALATDGVG